MTQRRPSCRTQCKFDKQDSREAAAPPGPRRSGFTLIELLVAMSILLVLAVITIRLVEHVARQRSAQGPARAKCSRTWPAPRPGDLRRPAARRALHSRSERSVFDSQLRVHRAPTNFHRRPDLLIVADGQHIDRVATDGDHLACRSGQSRTTCRRCPDHARLTRTPSATGAVDHSEPESASTAPAWVQPSTAYSLGNRTTCHDRTDTRTCTRRRGTSAASRPTWPTGAPCGRHSDRQRTVRTEFSWALTKTTRAAPDQSLTRCSWLRRSCRPNNPALCRRIS